MSAEARGEKVMKKFSRAVLCGFLGAGLALASCAPASSGASGSSGGSGSGSPDAPYTSGDPESDTLVVYFSWSGNTREMAEYIAEATGGDLFEIVPEDEYTAADLRWTDENSRVVQEYEAKQAGTLEDVALRDTTADGWEEYDTVFIGYPIWWYDAAWPVNTFVKANDFTGKTVYTFCTSSSSGLGNSTRNLADMAGSGDWRDGSRFSSGASESAVVAWLEEAGLIA